MDRLTDGLTTNRRMNEFGFELAGWVISKSTTKPLVTFMSIKPNLNYLFRKCERAANLVDKLFGVGKNLVSPNCLFVSLA